MSAKVWSVGPLCFPTPVFPQRRCRFETLQGAFAAAPEPWFEGALAHGLVLGVHFFGGGSFCAVVVKLAAPFHPPNQG